MKSKSAEEWAMKRLTIYNAMTVGKENKLKILIALNPLCSLYLSIH